MQDDQLRKLLIRLLFGDQLRKLLVRLHPSIPHGMINEHHRLVLNEHPNTVGMKLDDSHHAKMMLRTIEIGQIGPGVISAGMLEGELRGVAEVGPRGVEAEGVGRTLRTVLSFGLY